MKQVEHKIFAALTALLTVVLLVTLFALGVYGLDWAEKAWAKQVLKVIPLPAAVVNGNVITFADVERRTGDLEKLIEEELVRDIADAHGVGLDGIQRREWREVVSVELLKRGRDRSEAYAEIKQAALEIADGLEFVDAVESYSEDRSSKFIGGEIGLFEKEELPYWLEETALELEVGKVSDVVSSPEGYNLLQVTFRDVADDSVVVQVRRLLVREDFLTDELNSLQETARILIAK